MTKEQRKRARELDAIFNRMRIPYREPIVYVSLSEYKKIKEILYDDKSLK